MYLNNKDLYVEIIVSKAQGKLTRNAEKMLELLAKKTIKKMRYWSNDDKLDCYQSGLLDMFQNWYNFNEDKSVNAFAYFTEVFKRGIAKGYNELYKKKLEESIKRNVFNANERTGVSDCLARLRARQFYLYPCGRYEGRSGRYKKRSLTP